MTWCIVWSCASVQQPYLKPGNGDSYCMPLCVAGRNGVATAVRLTPSGVGFPVYHHNASCGDVRLSTPSRTQLTCCHYCLGAGYLSVVKFKGVMGTEAAFTRARGLIDQNDQDGTWRCAHSPQAKLVKLCVLLSYFRSDVDQLMSIHWRHVDASMLWVFRPPAFGGALFVL